jgi:tetratricopeptide (TPR) repeat protein
MGRGEASIDELQRQLETAYAAIHELDEDLAAGRISKADHAELKSRSERQAAALVVRLRRADAPAGRPRATGSTGTRAGRRPALRSPLVLTLAGVALVSFGLAVGVLVARFSSDERPSMGASAPEPGGIVAGAPRAGSAALERLRMEAEPENASTKKLLTFARLALDEGEIPAAITAYKRVLAREPKNPEALTHIGVILYQGNHVDEALRRIDEALVADPAYAPAHFDRAHILLNARRDYPAAARSLERFLALVPSGQDADRARAMLDQARRQPGAKMPATATGGAGR